MPLSRLWGRAQDGTILENVRTKNALFNAEEISNELADWNEYLESSCADVYDQFLRPLSTLE